MRTTFAIALLSSCAASGVLARRGYNVQSLAVGPSEKEGMSRIITVIPGEKNEGTSNITKQLYKLINVDEVKPPTPPFPKQATLTLLCSLLQHHDLHLLKLKLTRY